MSSRAAAESFESERSSATLARTLMATRKMLGGIAIAGIAALTVVITETIWASVLRSATDRKWPDERLRKYAGHRRLLRRAERKVRPRGRRQRALSDVTL